MAKEKNAAKLASVDFKDPDSVLWAARFGRHNCTWAPMFFGDVRIQLEEIAKGMKYTSRERLVAYIGSEILEVIEKEDVKYLQELADVARALKGKKAVDPLLSEIWRLNYDAPGKSFAVQELVDLLIAKGFRPHRDKVRRYARLAGITLTDHRGRPKKYPK